MTKRELLKIISKNKTKLDLLGVQSLAVFGSVARNEATTASDIDILVKFQGKATFDRYMDLKFFLEDLLGAHVDLVTDKAIKPKLRPIIKKEAVYVP
jgi:predicted nucleotidyltransferase